MIKKVLIIGLVGYFLTSCSEREASEENSLDLRFEMKKTIVDSQLSKSLGYKSLIVKEGEYEVDYCEENNGTVCLDLDDFERISDDAIALKNGFGVRIRIATQRSDCSSGIGFRCGLVMADQGRLLFPEREKLANIAIDEEGKMMTIEFLEPVNWEELKNEE